VTGEIQERGRRGSSPEGRSADARQQGTAVGDGRRGPRERLRRGARGEQDEISVSSGRKRTTLFSSGRRVMKRGLKFRRAWMIGPNLGSIRPVILWAHGDGFSPSYQREREMITSLKFELVP
jgi:hypothetical protein